MLETHTTKEGDALLVAEMEDRHLSNTIKLYCRAIIQARQAWEAQLGLDHSLKAQLEHRLYGRKEVDVEAVARAMRATIERLTPYLAEAFLRPAVIASCQAAVQAAIGRSEALPRESGLPLLSGGRPDRFKMNIDPSSQDWPEDGPAWDDRSDWERDPDEGDR